MEIWRRVWREGLAPQFSKEALAALRDGLLRDDVCLKQGVTISPPDLEVFRDAEIEGGCAITYLIWKEGTKDVWSVMTRFNCCCFECDSVFKETAIVRYFLNWWDETPRGTVRREMLEELNPEGT